MRGVSDSRLLALVSAAQFGCGVGGMTLGIRRGRAFDLPLFHGKEASVGRDSLLMGTALSAPVVMLGAQAGATAILLLRPNAAAARLLGGLGAVMVPGYLAERLVRRRLIPSGWDSLESPVVVAGMGLAAVMALLGLRFTSPDPPVRVDAIHVQERNGRPAMVPSTMTSAQPRSPGSGTTTSGSSFTGAAYAGHHPDSPGRRRPV